jgi:branched-chain amino acid transport system permease protein
VFLTLAMLILGGMRSVSGAVVGAIVVTVGFEIMRWFETGPVIFGGQIPQVSGLTGFFLGAIIVFFMALRPDGLVGDEELDEIVLRRARERVARLTARE